MTTVPQLMSWCTNHGYQLKSISHGVNHMDTALLVAKFAGISILCAAAYGVGAQGLSTFWSHLSTVYSTVRGWFGSKTTVTATAATPAVTATPAA